MKRCIAMMIALTLFLPASGQEWRGVYKPYDFNTQPSRVQVPAGYRLAYISHYGRHGSRFIYRSDEYEIIKRTFSRAASSGNLTAGGSAAWDFFSADSSAFLGRAGDLSPVGRKEQYELGGRYRKTYPSLFRRAEYLRAESSTSQRCISSMYCFIDGCRIEQSAAVCCETISSHMSYLSIPGRFSYGVSSEAASLSDAIDEMAVCSRLFKNPEAALCESDRTEFIQALFYFCAHLECIGLKDRISETVFTPEELMSMAELDNLKFHYNSGWICSENVSGAKVLLSKMLEQADSDMEAGLVRARLRFGHDGTIMKLMSLLSFGQWSSADWDSSEVCMASNICILFARNRDGDTLIQLRFNEQDISGWVPENHIKDMLR